MMKLKYYIMLGAFIGMIASCKKDNYKGPGSTFSGRIVDAGGAPINVDPNGMVSFQLWESGFGRMTPIDVNVKQDGSFSALLFDGNYKLTFPGGQGPWMAIQNGAKIDTLDIVVKGNIVQDLIVKPYYKFTKADFTYNAGVVTAVVDLQKVITDVNAKDIEYVALCLNYTGLVADRGDYNIARKEISGSDLAGLTDIVLSQAAPTKVPGGVGNMTTVFARVAIKIKDIDDRIYTSISEIKL